MIYSLDDIHVATMLKQAIHHVCQSKNDVNAALLGELKLHQYQAERIFCMTLGTGIGGAYKNNQGHIDNGELHKANEVGYLLYRPTENTTF